MIIKVDFKYDADYMYCPYHVDMEKLIQEFNEWIGNPSIEHPFWVDENHLAVCYRADAIVYWLNQYILSEETEKAKVLEEMVKDERKFDYTIVL